MIEEKEEESSQTSESSSQISTPYTSDSERRDA